MVGCLYLACKIEEVFFLHVNVISLVSMTANVSSRNKVHIGVQELVRRVSEAAKATIEIDKIISIEMTIVDVTRFHLTMHHPYRLMYGLRAKVESSDVSLPVSLWESAKALVRQSLLSDMQFLFSPLMIALAMVRQALRASSAPETLEDILPGVELPTQRLDDIDQHMEEWNKKTKEVSEEMLKGVDKKRRRLYKLVGELFSSSPRLSITLPVLTHPFPEQK